jgi:hypothetical protein
MKNKSTIYLIFLVALLVTTLCRCKKEYTYIDNKPQLEIGVKDNTGQPISGAVITLFLTQNDWNKKVNAIQTASSDSKGTVLFKDLEEKVYYFLVEKGTQNNVLGIAYFAQPLKINEIRVIQTIIN